MAKLAIMGQNREQWKNGIQGLTEVRLPDKKRLDERDLSNSVPTAEYVQRSAAEGKHRIPCAGSSGCRDSWQPSW